MITTLKVALCIALIPPALIFVGFLICLAVIIFGSICGTLSISPHR